MPDKLNCTQIYFQNSHKVFERLYELASIQKSEKNNRIKEQEQKKIDKELEELTLRPNINTNSKKVL